MQPVKIQTLKHTKGDTWEGLEIGPLLFNDLQPPYTLSDCRLYFRQGNTVGYKYVVSPGTGEGNITIRNDVTWEVTVEPSVLDLNVGNWDWDFETTDADGKIRTLYKGRMQITKENSYDD